MRTHAPHSPNGILARHTDAAILRLAVPAIITNITVPLLGLVDMAITGHMGRAEYIGAIAVGSMIFNVIYWLFGFLRMGTTGLTAQACGNGDKAGATRLLVRSVVTGEAVAAMVVVLRTPLFGIMSAVIGVDDGLRPLVMAYYDICVWGAPAMLALYALSGWLIGMQDTRATMAVSIIQNIVNIAASVALVYAAGMKIEGVAAGTLIAQYAGLAVAMGIVATRYKPWMHAAYAKGALRLGALRRFGAVNRDIFLRTLLLVAVNMAFVAAGAAQGATMLAVNALLMQLFTLFSYVMDGFAYAAEALCGRHTGAADTKAFGVTVRRLFVWGAAVATAYTALYIIGGGSFLRLLTDNGGVLAAAAPYFPWAAAIPAAGMAAFVWDGVFVGTTCTRGMLLSAAVAAALFFTIRYAAPHSLGNHALWLAFIAFLATRGIVQTVIYALGGTRPA